jgi:hypothetical protein
MPKFDCDATITFSYVVTAADAEAAVILLGETLGSWDQDLSPDDIEDSRIEGPTVSSDVSCIGVELVPG